MSLRSSRWLTSPTSIFTLWGFSTAHDRNKLEVGFGHAVVIHSDSLSTFPLVTPPGPSPIGFWDRSVEAQILACVNPQLCAFVNQATDRNDLVCREVHFGGFFFREFLATFVFTFSGCSL
jgi:hypothetical protein